MTSATLKRLHVKNGRVLAPQGGAGTPFALTIDDGLIVAAQPCAGPEVEDEIIDLDGGWLAPGLIDIQVNGGGGVLFNDDPTPGGLAKIGRAHLAHGVTGFMPTLVSATPEIIARALDAADAAINAGDGQVLGVHVEGPFISTQRRGIHTPERMRRLDDAAMALLTRPRQGRVMITLAPELCDGGQIDALVRAGVIVSLGHSDANIDQARQGFQAGARGVTHLFNAMSPLHHRAPGLVGAALDDPQAWCGLIADGVHVDPVALRLAFRIKGADRLILVSDSMPPIGVDMDAFAIDGRRILVRDGRYIGEDGALAGADLTLDAAVRGATRMMGASVDQAVQMASASPAAFLRLEDRGVLSPGARADLLWLDADLAPRGVWRGGRRVI